MLRVLVVDDEAVHRTLCRAAVDSTPGMQWIGEAANGAQGAELAEQLQPDVVVLDLTMPVMDGLEAIPLLRNVAPGARLVVWSNADDHLMRQALDLGAAVAVPKLAPATRMLSAVMGARQRERATERWLRKAQTHAAGVPAIR